jgi:glycosyltransferase involved in cell wall biosynthesis
MRRHILFIIPSLQGGGAERFIVTLLKHIDRSKFQLSLAIVNTQDAVYLSDVPEDVKVIDLACRRVRWAMPRIIRLIWKIKPDVVLSALGHLNLALAICRPFLPDGVRYIARESSIVSQLPTSYSIPFWWFWAYRLFYKKLDLVVCQSREMHEDLLQQFDFPAVKSVVINNPCDLAYVQKMAGAAVETGIVKKGDGGVSLFNLVAAGRFSSEKGFDLLIEAIALCGDARYKLTLLGDGQLREELTRQAAQRGVASQVRFAGFQKNPYPYLAQADAFVLSSRFDGFPNVVLEALACGTPVVALPAPGGVREVLSGLQGCAVAEDISAQALANALKAFRPGYRVSPEVLAPYSIETITRRYEAVLQEIAV